MADDIQEEPPPEVAPRLVSAPNVLPLIMTASIPLFDGNAYSLPVEKSNLSPDGVNQI